MYNKSGSNKKRISTSFSGNNNKRNNKTISFFRAPVACRITPPANTSVMWVLHTRRTPFQIWLHSTKFWLYLHYIDLFGINQKCVNPSKKCNYNPNLVWFNKIRKIFFCVCVMWRFHVFNLLPVYRATAITVPVPNWKNNVQRSCAKYAPAVSTVIRQFSKFMFSTPFCSCQLHQTRFIYQEVDTE